MATRKAKGLCYNCYERFIPGHRCNPSQFLCLLVESDDDTMDNLTPPEMVEATTETTLTPQISFHALTGQLVPSTLKLFGNLNGRSVIVLVDGGSTNNFIQTQIAHHLGLPIQVSSHLKVTVGNIDTLGCAGMCQQVPLQFGTTCFSVNLLLLPIYGTDLVLGVEWLAGLGPVLFDYKELWMEFAHESSNIRLLGLPLPRLLDHHISIVPNTTPVNVKPYHYPHFQKSEIEKLVGEMISDGIIRPSCSPYSSPVLLVKSKDGLWRFYVDYRALNSVMLARCEFGCAKLGYLGQLISDQGVCVDPDKIESIRTWPYPTSTKGLQGFLGLTRYYRRFVHHYASLAAPLTQLLRKQAFVWTHATTTSFDALKQAMMTTPVLCMPNFSNHFILQTDASGTRVGAVLTQNGQPVAYFSKEMSLRLQSASTCVLEMYAITEAIRKWRQYLWDITKLLGYDFDIVCKPGSDNGPIDSLSRLPSATLQAISLLSQPILALWDALREFYKSNPSSIQYFSSITDNPTTYPHHSICDGLLLYKGWVIIPHDSSFQPLVLAEMHFFVRWTRGSNMGLNCNGLYYTFAYGVGQDVFFVVVDRLSKHAHFLALGTHFIAPPQVFIKDIVRLHGIPSSIVRLHGIPSSIVLDRDLVFVSSFWRELFHQQGPKLAMSSAYHPQTNGQAEMTPFEAVYGRSPPSLLDYVLGYSSVASVEDLLQQCFSILLKLKENLLRAQNRMRNQENFKRIDVSFAVGDLERIGPVTYRLELPFTAKIHNVFHVSLLKKFLGDHNSQITPLPVQWENQPTSDATWEPLNEFCHDFPEFYLEGKVPSYRDANDACQHGIPSVKVLAGIFILYFCLIGKEIHEIGHTVLMNAVVLSPGRVRGMEAP
uniref:Integrase catalytic domain-containing protein n=1 Tax=Tanacetum cinerariifolium TaxID=118510 RepID=A0A699H4B8_TANCI|nr:hypothetical protein [Tanacetum cinerariifolium]